MMLADPEEIDAKLIGEDRFIDHVTDRLGMRHKLAVRPGGNIAERIQPEFQMMCHVLVFTT